MIALLLIVALAVAAPLPLFASSSAFAQQPPAAPPPDPNAAQFATPVGLLLVPVKPDRAKEYEAAILALQEALQKGNDARREMAKGWRVFKATETDAKQNLLYVHVLFPTVAGADYRPSLLLDELMETASPDLVRRYRDALAGPPSKLSLTEFAHMGTAPVKPQ